LQVPSGERGGCAVSSRLPRSEHLATERFGGERSSGRFGEIPLIPVYRLARRTLVLRHSSEEERRSLRIGGGRIALALSPERIARKVQTASVSRGVTESDEIGERRLRECLPE